jgi:ABC-2 type transport system permease protein
MSTIRLYLQGMKNSIAGRMTDRTDFLISMSIMLLFDMIVPFVTVIIYSTGASFPGWGLYEALLIQAIFLLAKGLSFPFFFGMVWNTIERVRAGTLDILLVKPRHPLFMLIVTAFDAEDLGKLLGGAALFIIAISQVDMPGVLEWLMFVYLLTLAVAMFFAFALIMSAVTIVWVGTFRVYELFDASTMFSLYPISIFSKSFRTIITMAIPVAVMGSMPAAVLLGKSVEGLAVVGAVVLIFVCISYRFWLSMMSQYKSAGG